ncbi:hypothetical protein EJ05DRAFT_475656 [Pseudovirgaria hyperparasitica]|uniref:DUF7053 domain-containing protein n=1 Tax=Pseudovirgaria hyperparasitica TaxID=470096 RepID=A0A6A6W8S8_9PEZI|nr:uncharacterized protein EJ05DRAFT_475656 [Pseudovirgaria hyperparasitica]KAF2758330.1 hypothetical protein EJ05DRAFT_475656 [Pseudovirgaria hyperparasitica]
MMRKKTSFTTVTPLPTFIPRQLAIDMLHSHEEVIKINPLVLDVKPTEAPRDAPADEFYSTWYEITQRIQYVPGMGKMGSGKIAFKGCFHNMSWGLQTHTLAPAGVDLRNKWQVCGNEPGEPVIAQELGIGAPPEGLYLREDIEVKCNMAMISFVKKELKAASKVMVDRIIKKAELLDSGVLHAMFDDGKLKTFNPADRTAVVSPRPGSGQYQNPLGSPVVPPSPGFGGNVHRPGHNEAIPMELPGDFSYANQQPQQQQHQQQGYLNPQYDRYSMQSNPGARSPGQEGSNWSDNRSNNSSRPTSYSSDGIRSPGPEQGHFAAELPTHQELDEHHTANNAPQVPPKVPTDQKSPAIYQTYNPQDYGPDHRPGQNTQRW